MKNPKDPVAPFPIAPFLALIFGGGLAVIGTGVILGVVAAVAYHTFRLLAGV